ncbi:unnamed protein product [Rotaria sordida]|uniref:G-protein coupled receptors family 3 profile domain-containing protein n=1 Tax=Rotaria sordida TaxID=392033 RepID=A0A814FHM4_9BILA|nr:unnamed protein product [Rotaria sordida]CAF0980759.1 unnamed protein product [Rotaria sordida]
MLENIIIVILIMRQKKFEQQHYHSRDDYDHISSSSSSSSSLSSSSSYIQLRNNNKMLTFSTSKQSLFNNIHIRSYIIIFLFIFLLLLLTFCILFPAQKNTNTYLNHRLKRQISSINIRNNDKQHYTDMLRRILLHRTSSSVLADCTINMALDGIYHLPLENSLSSEIIRLVEKHFQKEFNALKQTAHKIRNKINQTSNYLGDFALAKFRDEFSISIRLLLASQLSIKEINLMIATPLSNNNNSPGSYVYYDTLKYYRVSNHTAATTTTMNQFDYDSIHDVKLKQNVNIILQTFTPSNARETLRQTMNNNYLLINDGWWIGPVLCEKNKNETFIMAHIFPLTTSYFLVTYFNISTVDINQCANNDLPFGGTHKCPTGMECIHQAGQGFTLGAYECRCLDSYDNKNLTINGNQLEWNETNDDSLKSMINACECSLESCRLKHNRFLRTIIIIIQSIFIVFVAILAAIVFQRRKTKIIKHSMWILLELVLFGAALLYASVIVDSFGPHGIVCLIIPWLRELGFTIVYGTLILRIYKMLAEFQSRKAHCVQVKEKDILRILFFISISIVGYLLGWTLVNIDHSNENISLRKYLLGSGFTRKEGSYFQTCRPRSWDYLVQFAEFVFLCVGIRFIYSTRTAPCEYHERKLITIVIVCEMLFSTLLHIIRDCLWSTVDPDTLFILSVLRCHSTVTCMLILIFCTKLCYIFRPFNEDHSGRERFRSVPDGVEPTDLVTKLHLNGDIEFGELNLRDMDPEEIRAELKRLYTSVHVLKTKTMRKDNPHLTKRHGQRRKNRRFSIQPFQRHAGATVTTTIVGGPLSLSIGGDKHEHEPTKTPEDSTGSHNEPPHLGGISIHHGSMDDIDYPRGRTLSDITSIMPSTVAGQRVTFK